MNPSPSNPNPQHTPASAGNKINGQQLAVSNTSAGPNPTEKRTQSKKSGAADGKKCGAHILRIHAFVQCIAKLFSEIGRVNSIRCVAILHGYPAWRLHLPKQDHKALATIAADLAAAARLVPEVAERYADRDRTNQSESKRLRVTVLRLKALLERIHVLCLDPDFPRRVRLFSVEQLAEFASEHKLVADQLPPIKVKSAEDSSGKRTAANALGEAKKRAANSDDPSHSLLTEIEAVHAKAQALSSLKK
jgi:hypothetical protein